MRARVVDQNAAHGLRGNAKEMRSVLPFGFSPGQANVRFVD